MSIQSVMPSNHLWHPLLLLPSIFPSIRVFSNKLALRIRWPKYWSFSISPSNEYSGGWLPLGLTGLICSTTVWKRQFFGTQPSLWSKWAYLLYKKLFWEKKGRKKYVDGDLVWRCFWAVMTGQKLDGCGRRWNRGRECEIIFNNLEWGEEDKVKREKLNLWRRQEWRHLYVFI